METNIPDFIKLPFKYREQMLALALAANRLEVCGLVGGSDNEVKAIYPVPNVADDPAHQFLMGPEQQIETMRRIRDSGQDMIGIFHSHPETEAVPSATDRDKAAYPDMFYFIISLLGEEPALSCFYYNGEAFFETGIVLT